MNRFVLLIPLLFFLSCQKEDIEIPTEDQIITIEAGIGAMTKAVTIDNATKFETGDRITVYAWVGDAGEVPGTRVVDGVENTLGDDGKWTPDKSMLWKSPEEPHYFIGRYPAKKITDFTSDKFTIDPTNYEASDLLLASNLGGVKAIDGPVSLVFDHSMAKLNVNLNFRNQWNGTPTITKVAVKAKQNAEVDYLLKKVKATGNAEQVPITPSTTVSGYSACYSGLQVPQDGVTEIIVSIEGNDYVYAHPEDIPLVSGKYTTISLVVGRDKIELGSVLVSDWEPGVIISGETSLPVVSVFFNKEALNKETFINGKIIINDPLRRTSGVQVDTFECLVRRRGGPIAQDVPKKSYAIKLVDDKGGDLDAPVLGMRKENSWILDAMFNDMARMRNRVLFDVWNSFSKTPYETKYDNRNGTHGDFVELFVNGEYNGLYCLTDKIDRKLLNLKKAKDDNGKVQIRGVLYKGDGWSTGLNERFEYNPMASVDTIGWNSWQLKVPEDYPCESSWRSLLNFIDLCKADDTSFFDTIGDYIYQDNWVDYVLFLMAFNITDMPYKNAYLSNPDISKGSKLLITPWDLDSSFGRTYRSFESDPIDFDRFATVLPISRLIKNDSFKRAIVEKWHQLKATSFAANSVFDRIESYEERFVKTGAWAREMARWGGVEYYGIVLTQDISSEIDYIEKWYTNNLILVDEWVQSLSAN